jgi:hypothetical protein
MKKLNIRTRIIMGQALTRSVIEYSKLTYGNE